MLPEHHTGQDANLHQTKIPKDEIYKAGKAVR